jgi:hypothetical protein
VDDYTKYMRDGVIVGFIIVLTVVACLIIYRKRIIEILDTHLLNGFGKLGYYFIVICCGYGVISALDQSLKFVLVVPDSEIPYPLLLIKYLFLQGIFPFIKASVFLVQPAILVYALLLYNNYQKQGQIDGKSD